MRVTTLPFHHIWGPKTPEQNADNEAYEALKLANRQRCDALLANEEFATAISQITTKSKLSEYALWPYVGAQLGNPPGPYDYADTPEKVLAAYFADNPQADDGASRAWQAEQQEASRRNAKQAAARDWQETWTRWQEACAERKARHALALARHEARVAASKMQYLEETSDPAPAQPHKPV